MRRVDIGIAPREGAVYKSTPLFKGHAKLARTWAVHLMYVGTPLGQQIGTAHSLMFYKFRPAPRDAADTL
jgi:hypothetical protein